MVVKSGKVTAIRSVNPETGILEFVCPDGKPCPPGVQEALMLDTIERRANITAVGNWYGFYVPKRGIMVFKINKPHEVGKKPRGGQEICGRSGSGNWQEPLIDLQKSLPPMGFDQKSLIGSGIANNIQGCTVVELCMRYMDEKEIDGKRWFFRPVASFMSGHIGQISQTAKLEVKALLAEQKKTDVEKKKGVKAQKKLAKTAAAVAVAAEKERVAPRSGRFKLKTAAALAPRILTLKTPAPPLDVESDLEEAPSGSSTPNFNENGRARGNLEEAPPALPPAEEELINFENQGVVEPGLAEELIDFENQGVIEPPLALAPAPLALPKASVRSKKPIIRTIQGQNE